MEVTMKIFWFFFNGNKKHEFNYVSKSLKDVYGELEPKVVKMKKRSIDHTKFLAAINELKKSGGAIVIDKMERLFENKKNLPTYIYCIENKIDIRFIKSPQYNTNIYSDFNEDKLVVVHDILVIQLKTALAHYKNINRYIGRQTKNGIKKSIDQNGGSLPKRMYITKKRKSVVEYVVQYFKENKEFPSLDTVNDYLESRSGYEKPYRSSKAGDEARVLKEMSGNKPIYKYPLISCSENSYREYLKIAREIIEEEYEKILGIHYVKLW